MPSENFIMRPFVQLPSQLFLSLPCQIFTHTDVYPLIRRSRSRPRLEGRVYEGGKDRMDWRKTHPSSVSTHLNERYLTESATVNLASRDWEASHLFTLAWCQKHDHIRAALAEIEGSGSKEEETWRGKAQVERTGRNIFRDADKLLVHDGKCTLFCIIPIIKLEPAKFILNSSKCLIGFMFYESQSKYLKSQDCFWFCCVDVWRQFWIHPCSLHLFFP